MIFRSFTHALHPWDPLGAPMEDLPLDGLALVRAWLGHSFPAIPALNRSHVLRMQNNAKQIKSNNIKYHQITSESQNTSIVQVLFQRFAALILSSASSSRGFNCLTLHHIYEKDQKGFF